jgi:hypothetical protein
MHTPGFTLTLSVEVMRVGRIIPEEPDDFILVVGMGLIVQGRLGFKVPGGVPVESAGRYVFIQPEDAPGVFVIKRRNSLFLLRLLKRLDDVLIVSGVIAGFHIRFLLGVGVAGDDGEMENGLVHAPYG